MSSEQVQAAGGEFVTVARIRRSQGRRGEVLAEILTDFPERFATARVGSLLGPGGERRQVALEGHWFHKAGVVLKFAGVDDMAAAQALAGCELQIPASERRPLEGSSVYVSDLDGCRVVEKGEEIGTVRFLDTTVGTPVLVVDTPTGELLVPFAESICKRVDAAAGIIEVDLPEGLRDLNR